MQRPESEARALTHEESWNTIQATLDTARSSMYVAGTTTILLLWGVVASFGLISQYAIDTFATDLTARAPWIYAPLWGVLVAVGMTGSAVIGHRAGKRESDGDASRSAGIRVFLFWISVAVAAFFIPAAAGLWNADDGANIPRVSIGIVALGHILFGIMYRPVIAVAGAGIAVAFYVPSYLAGEAALVVTAVGVLVVVGLSAAWIRKSGVL